MEPFEFSAPKFFDFTAPEADFRDNFFGTCRASDSVVESEASSKVMPPASVDDMATDCVDGGGGSTPRRASTTVDDMATDCIDGGSGLTPRQASRIEDDLAHSMEVLQISRTPAGASALRSCGRTHPNGSSRKSHIMITRLDSVTGRLLEPLDFARSEAVSVESRMDGSEDVAGGPGPSSEARAGKLSAARSEPSLNKRVLEREQGDQDNRQHPHKYISMAEAVLKFHKKTPQRFHSTVPGRVLLPQGPVRPRDPTVPHSPQLTACTRVRQVHYPTREQREAQEVARIHQYKITAQPLDPRIFKSPKLGVRVPKVTEPQPFKLTEVVKKEPEAAPTYKFTAQPIPKNLLAPRAGPVASPAPRSAVVARRRLDHSKAFAPSLQVDNGEKVIVNKEVFNFGVPTEVRKNTPYKKSTEVRPFSFEERDKEMARRKEEKIKMYLEEEKRARIFHAHPLPNMHRKKLGSTCNLSIMSTNSSGQAAGSDENKAPVPFKATPATVLLKEPFVPQRPERSPLRPSNLVLKTQLRAKERKEYDDKVQAELEELQELQKEQEKERWQETEAELAALRKQAESFRARPAPKFKTPKKPVSDKKLTSPVSPFASRPASSQ